QARVITAEQLKEALSKQEKNERLGETLARLEYATEMQILKALEDSTGVQRVSLSNFTIDEKVLAIVDEEFCRRHVIILLRIEEKYLMFATSDPLDHVVIEDLRVRTCYRPNPLSAPTNEITTQIEKYYGFTRTLEALGVKQSISKEEEVED